MANIRIVRLSVRSSTLIEVTFTDNLSTSVDMNNISLVSINGTSPDPIILSTSVSGKIFSISVRPMVARAYYKFTLFSIDGQRVVGAKGEYFIEDGSTNVIFFIGQEEENEVRDAIIVDLPDIYNKESGTLLYDAIDSGARKIMDAKHSVGESRSATYVSIDVIDEVMTRGSGATDRFANEGVYKLLRVGTNKTGATQEGRISYIEFPEDPINLQQILVSNEVVSNVVNDNNSFSGLTITLANSPIIKVTSIVLTQNGIDYTYNIEQYRYGILDSKYDSSNSYTFLDILENQIKLTSSAIGPDFPMPQANDYLTISYYYRKVGRKVDVNSVVISTQISVVREAVPAVSTSFFIGHAPIITQNGDVPSINGITWLDTSHYDPSIKHPAFVVELRYNPTNIPKRIGEYSVNYETGQVFVFGTDGTGSDGTTITPPVATYLYKKTYSEGLDYVFYSDLNEVASIPVRDLRGNPATIDFLYEDNFADGTDFIFDSHIEISNERVENRLIDNIGIITLHGPVKEVFRIFNESTGELYSPSRITDNQVYFNSYNPPKTFDVAREPAQFELSTQSELVIIDTIDIGKPFSIFKINFEHSNLISADSGFLGTSFNTSIEFSDKTIFVRELYYDHDVNLNVNLSRLEAVGDYIIDYELGIVYLSVLPNASTTIGDASYRFGKIRTRNDHVIRVNDVYKSASVVLDNSQIFAVSNIEDSLIEVEGLQYSGEYKDVNGDPIVVSSDLKISVRNDIFRLGKIFQVTDLKTKFDPINFGEGAIVSSSSLDTITLNPLGVTVEEAGSTVQHGGRDYVQADRVQDLFNEGLVELISAVSVIDVSSGENYYIQGTDGYVDNSTNRICLPTGVIAAGANVDVIYKVSLRSGAAVLVEYAAGNIYVDYTYCSEEIIISYEYGDNVLDWSVSSALAEGQTYYVSYRYGALRNTLRDNFGVLTGIEELSNISDNLSRETYRAALQGSLQSFPKGPTAPSIRELVKAFTQINPNITESIFLEWVLGRDYLNLKSLEISANTVDDMPVYSAGKFGKGLLMNKSGQMATLPANSNLSLSEGTWECFVVPEWDGIANDAEITFDILFNGVRNINKVFIGSGNTNPTEIPFSLNSDDPIVLGIPGDLHNETGYFIWYDVLAKLWRVRGRAPITEGRVFSGNITTSGEFYNVRVAKTASGDADYEDSTQQLNEANDVLRSTRERISFSFIVDANDYLNTGFDAYDSYGALAYAGFDGIDFVSDNIHYLFDTSSQQDMCRMSLYKDGQGYLKYKIIDNNGSVRILSANIHNWLHYETHHVAVSWKINTIEQKDEMHLFVDGFEVPNTYRFSGYLTPVTGSLFMDEATELLTSSVSSPTVGGFDLVTVSGSNIVTASSMDFVAKGVVVGSRFVILDSTTDGTNTLTSPYVFVRSVTATTLELERGGGANYNCVSSLSHVNYSINPVSLRTMTSPQIEKVKVFSMNALEIETELYSPISTYPDYEFSQDGYVDYVNIYNGLDIGDSAILKTYGLSMARHKQYAYIWSNGVTNIINTKMPIPTSISRINVTKVLVRPTVIDAGSFSVIATNVGGHFLPTLNSNLDFCQPSNAITGRRLTVILRGGNIDFDGINKFAFVGETTDGASYEELIFTGPGEMSTTKYFIRLDDAVAAFTPIDLTKVVGTVEVKETLPLNFPDNEGEYAQIYLSIQQTVGSDGYANTSAGVTSLTDAYSRFDEGDIGKVINILSPVAIAGIYTIKDVGLDPSETVKDSNTVILNNTIWADSYSGVHWQLINTSFGDSGFANGLITLEIANSGGLPFMLDNCWYEIEFPTYLRLPWDITPDLIYFGSDNIGENQAGSVIDEVRILNELSTDTGLGESIPSSGRSITTDALAVREYTSTPQTLVLFHFEDNSINYASFYNSYSKSFRQCSNSVNENFGQSAVFNTKNAYKVDNKSVFNNNKGTIEFWVSPILDTYNDPTIRYYIDLSPEQSTTATVVTSKTVYLPSRARSISSVTITGSTKNYYTGGSLSSNGFEIILGQPLPIGVKSATVMFVPITSQGDRFSIFKDDNNQLVLYVCASGIEYQITAPIYWKKNSWHRVFVEWSLNNIDNQDRLVLMLDGTEAGIIRYGTGLLYGSGYVYGQQNVWGSASIGTASSRNILADINLLDIFNTIYIGADYTEEFTALARIDNIRFSSEPRSIIYMGGLGPGRLIGKDLLYSSNINVVQPVISDAITRLLLDFDTDQKEVEYLSIVRNKSRGIFDFYVEVIDTFNLADTDLIKELITNLINRLKPAHTRAFVSFIK